MNANELSNLAIAIVDDEVDLLEMLQRILVDRGASVTTFSASSDFLESLDDLVFDLLIVDIIMPGHDGLEITREVRRRKPKAAILAFSGGGQHFGAAIGLRAAEAVGADAVAYKPIAPATLVELVKTLVARNNASR